MGTHHRGRVPSGGWQMPARRCVMTASEEAQQTTLRDIERRKRQSTAAARSSRWWWIGSGLAVIAYGVAGEFAPDFIDDWGTQIVLVFLFLAIARNSRRGSRLAGSTAHRLAWGAIAVSVVLLMTAVTLWLDVPHLLLGFSIVAGLFLILAGPWWEGRMPARVVRSTSVL
jgi:hypothetical protein